MADAVAEPPAEEQTLAEVLQLPSWLDNLLKPGVGPGVFITLKLSLVGLVIVLCCMVAYIDIPEVNIHLKIFLGMSIFLLIIVVWFINELNASNAAAAAEAKEGKKE